MPKFILTLPLVLPLLTVAAPASMAADEAPRQFAMMDMMPMGAAAQPAALGAGAMPGMPVASSAPMPASGGRMGMDDDKMMPKGAGMPSPAQTSMAAGQPAQQPMAMCSMMQNMPRMGAAQQGMAPMPGASGSGMASGAGMGPGAGMGMDPMGAGATPGGMQPMGSPAARLEGRIAFLRTELRITDAQAPAWQDLATSLRAGLGHLDAARIALQDSNISADPLARLESYESHLRARTDAIHTTRMAFTTLFGQLDDPQKRIATSSMLPFIGAF